MHELPITKSVYKTVIARAEGAGASKVTKVVLEIGVLRDFIPEFVQKYWDYIAKDSIAEGAAIEIRSVGASAKCGKCACVYNLDKENFTDSKCPRCGYEYGSLVTGSELSIIGIEIEK